MQFQRFLSHIAANTGFQWQICVSPLKTGEAAPVPCKCCIGAGSGCAAANLPCPYTEIQQEQRCALFQRANNRRLQHQTFHSSGSAMWPAGEGQEGSPALPGTHWAPRTPRLWDRLLWQCRSAGAACPGPCCGNENSHDTFRSQAAAVTVPVVLEGLHSAARGEAAPTELQRLSCNMGAC